MERDVTRWAKKFDKVAHICKIDGNGTLCNSSAACLGNNYANTEMETCPECTKLQIQAAVETVHHDEKQNILDTLDVLVSNFLYYDRKEDEDLPEGAIEEAIESALITIKDIVEKFEIELRNGLKK